MYIKYLPGTSGRWWARMMKRRTYTWTDRKITCKTSIIHTFFTYSIEGWLLEWVGQPGRCIKGCDLDTTCPLRVNCVKLISNLYEWSLPQPTLQRKRNKHRVDSRRCNHSFPRSCLANRPKERYARRGTFAVIVQFRHGPYQLRLVCVRCK